MKKIVYAVVSTMVVAMTTLVFAGSTPAPLSTPELKKTLGTNGKATLVFFQNPFGRPCKNQREILTKLQGDRKGGFNLVSVNAMDQNDQKAFYDYGVRSLPSLVLVDKTGNIAKVFPPGIQPQETLVTALDALK